jgi:sulfatase maturation enzyme AslB (radical SAM superfamily)
MTMRIQSLSICVPGGCPNNCRFCVSKIHPNRGYGDVWVDYKAYKRFEREFYDRMSYCQQHGCTDVILTGDGEPAMNVDFLKMFDKINRQLFSAFKKVELQTSGVAVDEDKLEFLGEIGVKTIALSISSLDDVDNAEINRTSKKYKPVTVGTFVEAALARHFNLRLCLNLSSYFEPFFADIDALFARFHELGVHQATFRKLYTSNLDTEQDRWIREHPFDEAILTRLNDYIRERGRRLERLPFGAVKYSVAGISVVVDDDCMSGAADKQELKYAILRTNCKLYSKWDDKGSLIF